MKHLHKRPRDMDSKPTGEAADSAIHVPEPAHVHERRESAILPDTDSDSEEELEATELRDLNHNVESMMQPISHILSPGKPLIHWYDPMRRFWRHQIRISVPHDDCRDHLANERTFLGYLRNSIALSMMGILIAQLYRLEHSPDPSHVYGYFVLSKPLAVIFQSAALCVIVIGAIRFWRQQSAMAIGKIRAGGWEVITIGAGFFLLLLTLFALHIGVAVYKHYHPDQDWNS